MKSIDELLGALPVKDIRLRAGTYGNCGGVIFMTVDLEAGGSGGVEVVLDGADLPDWYEDFPEEAAECVHYVGVGAATGFRERFGTEPAVRLVIRRVRYNPVDVIQSIGPGAGRRIVAEAVGRATLATGMGSREPGPAPAETRRRLRVRIGRTFDGQPLELDLNDAAHGGMGPNGMLVGTAGSGKAEAVRGIVSGLAETHSPEELNLLLVDAGTAAGFERFENLPHTRAVVTGLTARPSLRTWLEQAVFAELDNRRGLLEQSGYDTHAAYERARDGGTALEPLPHLVIVVDDFGDLLSAAPDFIATLIQIGRLSRRLGLHLLLAAHRLAEGVVRGLDGFLPLRIGMRTATAAESRVVIGVNDACDLPGEPGHAYLKAGTERLIRFRFGPP